MPFGVWRRVRAQSLVEYGLIIAMVAVLCVASLLLFRPEIGSVLSNLSTSV
ncbi:MAG: pilus assembly protein [Chloroflexi bacterium]|nr:pilus assembly protein [Chloroflexota bacterium]MBV9892887.1 pilus assembly protein [Chloroflexota bacterium]